MQKTKTRRWQRSGIGINVSTISASVNMPVSTSKEDIRVETQEDACLKTGENIYNTRLATQNRGSGTHHATILANKKQSDNNVWHQNEG